MARVRVAIQRERFPVAKLRPLVVTRCGEVVKAMFCVTAEVARAKAAGGVQVTPVGAVPVDTQVRVTVPLKLALGVRTRPTEAELPAFTLMEVEVLPVVSATVKSGAGAPVPVRDVTSGVDEAPVTT